MKIHVHVQIAREHLRYGIHRDEQTPPVFVALNDHRCIQRQIILADLCFVAAVGEVAFDLIHLHRGLLRFQLHLRLREWLHQRVEVDILGAAVIRQLERVDRLRRIDRQSLLFSSMRACGEKRQRQYQQQQPKQEQERETAAADTKTTPGHRGTDR